MIPRKSIPNLSFKTINSSDNTPIKVQEIKDKENSLNNINVQNNINNNSNSNNLRYSSSNKKNITTLKKTSGYLLFCSEIRAKLNSKKQPTEIIKEAAKLWKNLNFNLKKKYNDEAFNLNIKYKEENEKQKIKLAEKLKGLSKPKYKTGFQLYLKENMHLCYRCENQESIRQLLPHLKDDWLLLDDETKKGYDIKALKEVEFEEYQNLKELKIKYYMNKKPKKKTPFELFKFKEKGENKELKKGKTAKELDQILAKRFSKLDDTKRNKYYKNAELMNIYEGNSSWNKIKEYSNLLKNNDIEGKTGLGVYAIEVKSELESLRKSQEEALKEKILKGWKQMPRRERIVYENIAKD